MLRQLALARRRALVPLGAGERGGSGSSSRTAAARAIRRFRAPAIAAAVTLSCLCGDMVLGAVASPGRARDIACRPARTALALAYYRGPGDGRRPGGIRLKSLYSAAAWRIRIASAVVWISSDPLSVGV